MKNPCGQDKKDLMKWVDGELGGRQAAYVSEHLEKCASCGREAEAFRRLNNVLRVPGESLTVSPAFESMFWAKVSQRQELPWFKRVLNIFETLIPEPNFRQAVAFAVLAFFVGNAGGVASFAKQETFAPASFTRHFTEVQRYKGIAPYSLAGSYLSDIKNEVSQ